MQEIRRKKIRMKKTLYIIRDIAITVGIQLVCFMVCLWIQNSTVENALIPAVSIFGVFLTSVITPGYLYGVAAAILSVLELNFAFTFPFFHFNFSIVIQQQCGMSDGRADGCGTDFRGEKDVSGLYRGSVY